MQLPWTRETTPTSLKVSWPKRCVRTWCAKATPPPPKAHPCRSLVVTPPSLWPPSHPSLSSSSSCRSLRPCSRTSNNNSSRLRCCRHSWSMLSHNLCNSNNTCSSSSSNSSNNNSCNNNSCNSSSCNSCNSSRRRSSTTSRFTFNSMWCSNSKLLSHR